MELPKDPMILFSFVNMKLRDNYASLDDLCEDMDIRKEDIIEQLKSAGFEYSSEHNKFWWFLYSEPYRFLGQIANLIQILFDVLVAQRVIYQVSR